MLRPHTHASRLPRTVLSLPLGHDTYPSHSTAAPYVSLRHSSARPRQPAHNCLLPISHPWGARLPAHGPRWRGRQLHEKVHWQHERKRYGSTRGAGSGACTPTCAGDSFARKTGGVEGSFVRRLAVVQGSCSRFQLGRGISMARPTWFLHWPGSD
jgi:hypothetical protein